MNGRSEVLGMCRRSRLDSKAPPTQSDICADIFAERLPVCQVSSFVVVVNVRVVDLEKRGAAKREGENLDEKGG